MYHFLCLQDKAHTFQHDPQSPPGLSPHTQCLPLLINLINGSSGSGCSQYQIKHVFLFQGSPPFLITSQVVVASPTLAAYTHQL